MDDTIKVIYFGIVLEVPADTVAIAMDGKGTDYRIYAYNSSHIEWSTSRKYWLVKDLDSCNLLLITRIDLLAIRKRTKPKNSMRLVSELEAV